MRNYKTEKTKIMEKINGIEELSKGDKISRIDARIGLVMRLKRGNYARYSETFEKLDAIYREEALFVYVDKRDTEDRNDTVLLDFYTHQEEQRRARELSHIQKSSGIDTSLSINELGANGMINTGEVLFNPSERYKKMLKDLSVIDAQGMTYGRELKLLLALKLEQETKKNNQKMG